MTSLTRRLFLSLAASLAPASAIVHHGWGGYGASKAALELGNYLVHTPAGERRIKAMIVEDIDPARARDDVRHAALLKLVLKHFVEAHAAAK